jgi:hypothetical protein
MRKPAALAQDKAPAQNSPSGASGPDSRRGPGSVMQPSLRPGRPA